MNIIDLIFIIILATFGLMSLTRGAAKELFPFLGMLVGLALGHNYHPRLGGYLSGLLDDKDLANLMAFAAIFALSFLVGEFLGGLVNPTALLVHPEIVNRLLGVVLGLGKGLAICLAIYYLVENFIPPFQATLHKSLSLKFLTPFLGVLS